MSKISVIIPVYNTGKYLKRCVDSIINQTHKDLDIIIVDDGSLPETAGICDSIAESDSRIRVFHKENQGVSVARNFGLTQVQGKFVGFVDSDDWIEPEMYENLLYKIEISGADVVFCDAVTIWDNGRKEQDTFINLPTSQGLQHNDITPEILIEMAGSVWRGLYRSKIIDNIRFPEGLKFSEDRYFNLQVLSKTNKIYYLKETFYCRYMRNDSCVNTYHPDAVSVTCKGFDMMAEYASRHFGNIYSEEYRRKELVSFIGILYGVLHCGKGIRGCFQEFKKVASLPFLHELIRKYGTSDIRLRLVRYRFYFFLFVLIYVHDNVRRLIHESI